MKNNVQLIVYADRLGRTIEQTHVLIEHYFGESVGGVHVLPFFTPYDGADAGFDPTDHTTVDPRLGTWDDIAALARSYDVVVDVIVNHVSSESAAFQDYVRRGEASPYASMFLTYGAVFPDGATEQDLTLLYRPRPGLPFTPQTIAGRKRLLWTTFTSQQIDIDIASEPGRDYLHRILHTLSDAGVAMVRLDAVGYAVKTAGTSSFMTTETIAFIQEFAGAARDLGMEVLVEVHSHYESQIRIGQLVDRVYDFALPPLVLYALYAADADPLYRWLEIRPQNCVTVLDTHDGIGVIDVGPDALTGKPGLLSREQVGLLVEGIHEASHGESRLATGAAASNVDIYQVNCTFYDAVGQDDAAYLLARAIQFFAPGIPQVYYVGALAGVNDTALLSKSQVGRDINRHYYDPAELDREVERPVVRALLELMRFRNTHPAFNGECELHREGSGFCLSWTKGGENATLSVQLVPERRAVISWTDGGRLRTWNLRDEALPVP